MQGNVLSGQQASGSPWDAVKGAGESIKAGADKVFTKENRDKAAAAAANAKKHANDTHEELKRAGIYNHFGSFNRELIKPWDTYGGFSPELKTEAKKTFVLMSEDSMFSFQLCNSLSFFAGVLSAIWSFLRGHYLEVIWGTLISYLLAYWFYFAFVIEKSKYSTCSQISLAIYVAFTLLSAFIGLIYPISSIINFAKAYFAALMLWYAHSVTKMAPPAESAVPTGYEDGSYGVGKKKKKKKGEQQDPFIGALV